MNHPTLNLYLVSKPIRIGRETTVIDAMIVEESVWKAADLFKLFFNVDHDELELIKADVSLKAGFYGYQEEFDMSVV